MFLMMSPVRYIGLLAFLLGGSLVQTDRPRCWAQERIGGSSAIDSQLNKMLQNFVDETRVPGLALAVSKNNVLFIEKAVGFADLENSVELSPDSRFRTASIAKSLTATVVMKLVEDGEIDLDVEVQQYCSAYPKKKWPITTRQVLGHLAGIRHYRSSKEANATDRYFSLSSALATFRNDPLLHEPGTKFLYSSFGYNLLGSIAEGAAHDRFQDLLAKHVLVPSEMNRTVIDDQAMIVPGRVRGYTRATEAFVGQLPTDHNLVVGELYNAPLHDTSMKIPGGGLLSTSPDLVRFANALNTGKLVSDSTREAMWTKQRTTSGDETGYGLGWLVSTRKGEKIVWHTGGQSGTSTILWLNPGKGIAVAIMCNLQNTNLKELAIAIADLINDQASS